MANDVYVCRDAFDRHYPDQNYDARKEGRCPNCGGTPGTTECCGSCYIYGTAQEDLVARISNYEALAPVFADVKANAMSRAGKS